MNLSSRVAINFFSCLVSCCMVLNPSCKQKNESNQNLEIKTESLINPVRHFAETITIEELKEHIVYLASDKLEGRLSSGIEFLPSLWAPVSPKITTNPLILPRK